MTTPLVRRALAGLVALGLAVAPLPAGASQIIYMPLVNPTSNIAPNPNFLSSGACSGTPGNATCANPCVSSQLTWVGSNDSLACANYTMQAINDARASLGEGSLTLPSNWLQLTVPEQLFTIANMERTSAGYPAYLGLNDTLSAEAQTAASNNADPGLAPGFPVGNNPWGVTGIDGAWAGTDNVLFADYIWMYDDGWGGSNDTSNIACTSTGAPGCWGHRDQLLGSGTAPDEGVGLGCTTCVMGAAADWPGGGPAGSLVDLIELPARAVPPLSFTWASELAYFPAGANPPATPTVDPHGAPAPVSHFSTRVLGFSAHGLRVAWSVATGAPIVVVAIISRGVGCHTPSSVEQTITHGATHGVITVPIAGHFSFGGRYSVRFMVGAALGTTHSACLALGILRR